MQIFDMEVYGFLIRYEVRFIKFFNYFLYFGYGGYLYLNDNVQIEKIKVMQGERI